MFTAQTDGSKMRNVDFSASFLRFEEFHMLFFFFSFLAVSLRFSGGVAAAQLRVCNVFALEVAEVAAETAAAGGRSLRGEDRGDKWTLQPE